MSAKMDTNLNQIGNSSFLFEELDGNLNDDSFRRMSIDSGLSMSPNSSAPSSGEALQQRRKKKKRIRSR
jgi:hypothetical protein